MARPAAIELSLTSDLAALERDWRDFEREADCTVFQTYEWQSAWMQNVAPHQPVTPVIVVGRTAGRRILFLIPLALRRGKAFRSLTWLASDLCDYNAPLLARDFAGHVDADRFAALWQDILGLVRSDPKLRPDVVILEKMPESVGAQANPFMALDVAPNPSSAYLTHLSGSWDEFYMAKRSSATRRRDRTKLKRLADFGEVRFTTPGSPAEVDETLSLLFAQKGKSFARMGVPDIFQRPGWADFFRRIATDASGRKLCHVSRLDVGNIPAATNFGLIFGGRYYHILAGYEDGDVAKYGPGAAHLRELMRYAIENGCNSFDFTIGDEGYKREWSDTTIRLHDTRLPLTSRGSVVARVATLRSSIKRTIKQTPWLWQWATRLRSTLGRRNQAAADPVRNDETD